MLLTVNLEKFRHGDFIQYMNNLLDILTNERATTLHLSPQRDELYTTMRDLNEIWQPQVGSELTPEIVALDKQRDMVFNGLKGTVDVWAVNHYREDWRNAAFLISDNIKAHGDKITVMRYQLETATINAVLHDLESQYTDQVTLLGLGEWVAELRTANDRFDEKYLERTQAMSGHQPGVVVQHIDLVTTAFRALQTAFTSRFNVAKLDSAPTVDEFQTVENDWNYLTEQYNEAVNRYANPEEEEEPEEDPTEG